MFCSYNKINFHYRSLNYIPLSNNSELKPLLTLAPWWWNYDWDIVFIVIKYKESRQVQLMLFSLVFLKWPFANVTMTFACETNSFLCLGVHLHERFAVLASNRSFISNFRTKRLECPPFWSNASCWQNVGLMKWLGAAAWRNGGALNGKWGTEIKGNCHWFSSNEENKRLQLWLQGQVEKKTFYGRNCCRIIIS
jgi:hypothetical protein